MKALCKWLPESMEGKRGLRLPFPLSGCHAEPVVRGGFVSGLNTGNILPTGNIGLIERSLT